MDVDDEIDLLIVIQVCSLVIQLCRIMNRNRRRRWGVHPLNQRRPIAGVYSTTYEDLRLHPDRFHNYTRFSVQQFDELLNLVRNNLTRRNTACTISPEMRLLLTLRFFVCGDLTGSFTTQYRCGRSTFLQIVQSTCDAIYNALAPMYLTFPNKEDFKQIADSFNLKWQFPLCLGCIDGKRIKIESPPNSGCNNFNNLRYDNMVLLAVCDADYRIIFFDVGNEDPNSDSGILQSTEFGRRLIANELDLPDPTQLPNTPVESESFRFCFLGDEAFPLGDHMMRPYPELVTTDNFVKKCFNYRCCRASRVIENTFGILAARFRFLHRPMQGKEENIIKYVSAAIALHNFLMMRKDIAVSGQYASYKPDTIGPRGEIITPGTWRAIPGNGLIPLPPTFERNDSGTANHQRQLLATYFSSPEGRVEWQDQRVADGAF